MQPALVAPFSKKLNLLLIQFFILSSLAFSLSLPYYEVNDNGATFNAIFDLPQVIFGTTRDGIVYSSNMYKITIINGGIPLNFTLTFMTSPNTSLIKVYFDKTSFKLDAKEKFEVGARIVVKKGIPSGDYTLYIRIIGFSSGSGNVVRVGASKKILVYIGGSNPITLRINTLLNDGTPIPGEFYVYWKVNGSLLLLHHDLGPSKLYYVIAGEYVIRGIFNNNLTDEKDIVISKNTTVNLYFTPFIISNFKIDRPPLYTTDPLIFSFVLENKIPTLKGKIIEVRAYIMGSSSNTTQDLGRFIINGEQSITVRGVIEPPNTWKNESYQITISITSNGKVLSFFKSILEIHVKYPSLSKPEANYFLLVLSAGIGGAIGAVGVMVISKRKKVQKSERGIHERVKKILIMGQGRLLFVYNIRLNRVQFELLESDDYLLLTSMISSIIQLAKSTSNGNTMGSMMFGDSKYIYMPIDENFTIVVETERELLEFEPQVQNLLKVLSAYVYNLHQKHGIGKVEDIINLNKYAERFSELPSLLKKLLK